MCSATARRVTSARAGAPHPHLIDVATGEIVEVEDDDSLARLIEEEARRMGFRLVEFRLKLFGEKI